MSTINDRYGRHTGDFLLQLIAGRLKDMTQGTDCLAHFGGGRFGLATMCIGLGQGIAVLFERIER